MKKCQSKNPLKGMVKAAFKEKVKASAKPKLAFGGDVGLMQKPMLPRQPLKKGGCAVKKLAAGGVAKIRHKEATKSGKPMKAKVGKLGNSYK